MIYKQLFYENSELGIGVYNMTTARKETFDIDTPGVYHCVSRCVRRAFLCGYDKLTGKNYNHRKQWVKQRLEKLEGIFFIDVYAFAIMSNHSHVVLANKPMEMRSADDFDIARRWLTLFPRPRSNGKPREDDIQLLASDKKQIEKLRLRLGNISWFMRCLNERIARMANKEDEVTGRFFEGRYKSTKLENEASILACMVYVDLNEVRAKLVATPEESLFTSVFERIKAQEMVSQKTFLVPIEKTDGRKGIFSDLTLAEYLTIVDETGRQTALGKRGKIPPDIEPILTRLSLKPDSFLEITSHFDSYFYRIVGAVELMKLAAQKAGKKWFRGMNAAQTFFA